MRTDQKLLRQRRQATAILIVGVFVVLISLFFGLGSLSRFRQAEAAWEAHNARATAVANALENFNRHTGYGGFIHNFKNLVLRRDLPRYQERIESNIAGLRADLDHLDTLINAPGEEAALAQLRATFEEYATNYAKVYPMVTAGASSDELDAVVKVDDGPALAALAQLKTHVNARAEQAQVLAQATHADALRFAWIGGGLMMTAILAAILAIVIMMLLQHRIVAANQIIRKTQEHLAEREQQLLETQRIAHLGGWKLDRPSGRLSWTEETFRIFGLPVTAQPSAEQAISYFLPESRQVFEQALNAAIQDGESFSLELQMRTAQGELRWVCAQAEGKPEAAGPSAVMGTFQDISERKQAQLASEAAHRQLQATLDALPDLLFEVDAAGLIVHYHYHSHRGDLLAAPPEMLIGKGFADFLPPDAARVCQDAIDEATKNGFSGGATYRLALAQGEHWFELFAAPMHVEANSNQHFIVICRDITERKRTEETLMHSEQRIRDMSDAAGVYLWEVDANIVYTYVSSRSTHVKGYSPADLLGHSPMEFMPEEDIQSVGDIVGRAIASGSTFRLQHRDVTRDGKVLWEEVYGAPYFDENRGLLGLRGTGMDINARKSIEAELIAAKQAAENANLAKSRFLAAASHDLRQPLSALTLFVGVLKKMVPASCDTVASKIDICIESLNELLTDLLDISKLDARVVTPKVFDFSVDDLLATLVSTQLSDAEIKGLRLRVRRCSVFTRTDPLLLKRILANLLSNAIRYTDLGGVLIACRRYQGKQWIEVWDTGIGIPADSTSVIFEEFKQLGDESRSRGSGLGLAIAAKTAALLGLEIRLKSRPGRGSMFAVELPAGRASTTEASPSTLPTTRALKIALVEDNLLVLQSLALTLECHGHQVIAAQSGAELLEKLGEHEPDMVISDYRLARSETGFDVIKRMRDIFGDTLPALLITGDTDPALVRSMADRGITILYKPLQIDALQTSIRDAIERQSP